MKKSLFLGVRLIIIYRLGRSVVLKISSILWVNTTALLANCQRSSFILSWKRMCFVYWKPLTGTLANSEDPDEMPHNPAFHQGPNCFLKD